MTLSPLAFYPAKINICFPLQYKDPDIFGHINQLSQI